MLVFTRVEIKNISFCHEILFLFCIGLAYFRSNNKNDDEFDDASFLSFTLLPSPFPRKDFEYAVGIQEHWNRLMHSVSNDYEFLYNSLRR